MLFPQRPDHVFSFRRRITPCLVFFVAAFLHGLIGSGLGLSLSLMAQPSPLLVKPLYDETYASLPGERTVAAGLRGQHLPELVESGVISREDMLGLALPLGVHRNQQPVDFYAGMLAMWQAKAQFLAQREASLDPSIMVKALAVLERMRAPAQTMTLLGYRRKVLGSATTRVSALHQEMRDLYSPARRAFMDLVVANLSPNVMLGYNLQEMLPPDVGDLRQRINPLFKAYYLDRLLREAGTAYVAGFPARYDGLLSFGPFQLTQVALDDLRANRRLGDGFIVYGDMQELATLEDHAWAAALFAYNNWERLSYFMQSYGGLDHFNRYFATADQNPTKRRSLRIFIAGISACMHHQPIPSWNIVQEYIKQQEDLGAVHHELFDYARANQVIQATGKLNQLDKYYRSAAEAYLILKVYDQLIE